MIELHSHGLKAGYKPLTVDFDCRNLPNPYTVRSLRLMTGKMPTVQAYVFRDGAATKLLNQAKAQLDAGATELHFFCMGGQHRSPAVVERLAKMLRANDVPVRVKHWVIGD